MKKTLLQKYRILRSLVYLCVVFNFLLVVVLFFHLKRRNNYTIEYHQPPKFSDLIPAPVPVSNNFPHIQFSSTNVFSSSKVSVVSRQEDLNNNLPITRSIRYNYAIIMGVPVIYFNSPYSYRVGDELEDGFITYISPRFIDLENDLGNRFRWINSNHDLGFSSGSRGGITGREGTITLTKERND